MANNSTRKRTVSFGFLLLLAAITANVTYGEDSIAVHSFEMDAIDDSVGVDGVEVSLVTGDGVTEGSRALQVAFPVDRGFSSIKFQAKEPWDCSGLKAYRLSFDATNTGPSSIVLYCRITANDGVHLNRMICVPKGGPTTYYFELVGEYVDTDRGLREDPQSLEGVGTKMVVAGLKQKGDCSKIKLIEFFVRDGADPDVLVFDNLKFVTNPPVKENYYEKLVDEFGQSTAVDFDGKVKDAEDLQRRTEAELAELNAGGWSDDRSQYGGWKKGPKLKATGFFRTEKIGDRWTMVDPDGYLYYATGIANVRMSNTSTFTGVDFRDDSVRYRDPEDVTPEDSLDIKPSSDEARATAHVAYPERRKFFTWLPEYSDPLAKHYGYRREAHIGPIRHGEVFTFYRANLERKYGGKTNDEIMANWRDITIKRFKDWGFTCTGNWTDASYYQMNRLPYFANGWIIGEFKTVSSGHDYWGPMPDVFDPEFERRAKATVKVIADEVQNNPWCVGVFVDNEKSWGNMNSPSHRFGIVINGLALNASESPLKAAWVEKLKSKYGDSAKLNEAWGTDVESWDAFAAGFPRQEKYEDPEMLNDFSELSQMYCDGYFRIVHDALAEVMPNHMYLGCRMAPWALTAESRQAASKYCDMMSYNFYHEQLGKRVWDFLPHVDKPSIIGEWHMGSNDTGYFHSGIIHAADQQDRAAMYTAYMQSVIENPYFVGAHWFQYLDSPVTGRPHDGENYPIGFVTVADIPYKPLVDAAKAFNKDLYEKAYGQVADQK